MIRPDQSNNPRQFFKATQKMARLYPVRAAMLTNGGGEPLGMVLLDRQLDAAAMESILDAAARNCGLASTETQATTKIDATSGHQPSNPLAELPDGSLFRDMLQVELDRVARTRLPCSLLLLQIDEDDSAAGQADHEPAVCHLMATLGDHLHQVDIVGRHGPKTIAAALPGTGLGHAIRRAEHIQEAIRRRPMEINGRHISCTLSGGLVICSALDLQPAASFLAKAEEQLQQAQKGGSGRLCHQEAEELDSCQVTVAERAQLFRTFTKDSKP